MSEYSLKGIHTLVAEDNLDNQVVIRGALSKLGARVETVNNGREAFKRALDDTFNLVLMDLQMPEMDGYAATKALRSHGFTKPIVALTARAMAEEREQTLAAGCVAHLTKPLNLAAIVETVRHYCLNQSGLRELTDS